MKAIDTIRAEVDAVCEAERTQYEKRESDNGNREKNALGFDLKALQEALANNERGDAHLFTEQNKGKLCFDHSAGEWLDYGGHSWDVDKTGLALSRVDGVAEQFARAADTYYWRSLNADKQGNETKKAKELKKYADCLQRVRVINTLQRRKNILTLASSGPDSLGTSG